MTIDLDDPSRATDAPLVDEPVDATLTDQEMEVARRVVELLDGRTIATAESCTAGRVAVALATVEHAASFLRGGLVAYQEQVKRDLLGVTAASVLSLEAAAQMAAGASHLLGADVTVATSGVAGDQTEEGTPPGTVYIATQVGGLLNARHYRFDGTPQEVCESARRQALLDLVAAMSPA